MQKILGGLFALVVLAVVVGATTHWLVGVGVVVVFFTIPVAVVYVRLKISTNYRTTTDATLTRLFRE